MIPQFLRPPFEETQHPGASGVGESVVLTRSKNGKITDEIVVAVDGDINSVMQELLRARQYPEMFQLSEDGEQMFFEDKVLLRVKDDLAS